MVVTVAIDRQKAAQEGTKAGRSLQKKKGFQMKGDKAMKQI